VNHQKHPFPNPKNHGGGNFKKYAKGFSGGARAGLPAQAARLTLALRAKMGSSVVVKGYQYDIRSRIFVGSQFL
jgi:hypothetical protein